MGLAISFMNERADAEASKSHSNIIADPRQQKGWQGNMINTSPTHSSVSSSASFMSEEQSDISVPIEKDILDGDTRIKWEKGGLIGQGAFGKVYLGLNQETGELMAVKQFDLLSNISEEEEEEHFEELRKEINLLSQLSHLNIVSYYATEKTEENLNIFLEYVSGGSIHLLLKKFGRLSESVISVYTKQILLGLNYLHENSIIHRDIKGANILVDNNGVIKLADFGASKKIDEMLVADSEVHSLRGSPYWMAPEVVRQEGQNKSSDIWSLGCTMIEMATGRPPWSDNTSANNPISVMFKIANSKTGPPLPEGISAHFVSFLRRCLATDPKKRATASELLTHPFVAGKKPRRLSDSNPQRGGEAMSFDQIMETPTREASVRDQTGKESIGDSASFQLIEKSLKTPKDALQLSRPAPSYSQDSPLDSPDLQEALMRIQSPRKIMSKKPDSAQAQRRWESTFNYNFERNANSSITFTTDSSLAPLPARRRKRSIENKEKAGAKQNEFDVRMRRIDSAPAEYNADGTSNPDNSNEQPADEKIISGFLNAASQMKKLLTKDISRPLRYKNGRNLDISIKDLQIFDENIDFEPHPRRTTHHRTGSISLDDAIDASSSLGKHTRDRERVVPEKNIPGGPVTPRSLEKLSHRTSANRKARERQIELLSLQRRKPANSNNERIRGPPSTPSFDFLEPI